MGLIIGRRNFTLNAPMWKFYINLSIVTCYFLGALTGGYAIKDFEDNQLLINISLYGMIIVLYFIFVKKEKEYRCCFAALGLSSATEEEYHSSTAVAVTSVPQSEESADKKQSDEEEQQQKSVTTSAEVDPYPDSDEEEDKEEPLTNQVTEEDRDERENCLQEEGGGEGIESLSVSSSTGPSHDKDVESADLSSIQLTDIQQDTARATATKQTTPSSSTSTAPPPAALQTSPPTPCTPTKEMEDAWSFRVMMLVVCLLCFNAAFINATTKLSSKEIFTSHITGLNNDNVALCTHL